MTTSPPMRSPRRSACRANTTPGRYALLEESYAKRGIEFTEARKRMARMPRGAEHIDNPVSVAPGFRIGNVHVMAGVPSIFQAMLDNVVPTLQDRHQAAVGDGRSARSAKA